jgi:hypothetical protein
VGSAEGAGSSNTLRFWLDPGLGGGGGGGERGGEGRMDLDILSGWGICNEREEGRRWRIAEDGEGGEAGGGSNE